MSPYNRLTVSEDEHTFYQWLAHETARRATLALAAGEMRQGMAHKYLIAAHLQMLMEGGGEDSAMAFLDQCVEDLTATPSERLQAARDDIAFRQALARNLTKPGKGRAPRG